MMNVNNRSTLVSTLAILLALGLSTPANAEVAASPASPVGPQQNSIDDILGVQGCMWFCAACHWSASQSCKNQGGVNEFECGAVEANGASDASGCKCKYTCNGSNDAAFVIDYDRNPLATS